MLHILENENKSARQTVTGGSLKRQLASIWKWLVRHGPKYWVQEDKIQLPNATTQWCEKYKKEPEIVNSNCRI